MMEDTYIRRRSQGIVGQDSDSVQYNEITTTTAKGKPKKTGK